MACALSDLVHPSEKHSGTCNKMKGKNNYDKNVLGDKVIHFAHFLYLFNLKKKKVKKSRQTAAKK